MAVKIRNATPKDVPALTKLWYGLMDYHMGMAKTKDQKELYELRSDAGEKWVAWLLSHLQSKDSLVLVAEDNGKIVGYSLSTIKPNVPIYVVDKLGHMHDLYIEPEYRGKGVGKTFFQHVMTWLKKKRIKYVSIGAQAINLNAREIYRKWGNKEFYIELRKRIN